MRKAFLAGLLAAAFLAGHWATRAGISSKPPTDGVEKTAVEKTAVEKTAVEKTAEPSDSKQKDKPPKVKRPQRVNAATDQVRHLRALPYLDARFDPDSDQRGVTLHEEESTFEGLNFYSSRALPAAFLLDMKGRPVYQWRVDRGKWQHVDLLPTGEVLVLVKDQELFKVDLQSKVLWRYRARVHHDHWRTPEGRIYVLSRRTERLPEIHPRHPVVSDAVTVLTPDGQKIEEIPILPMVLSSSIRFLLPSVSHRSWSEKDERDEEVELDILHTNHVEVFDGALELRSPIFKKGNALLSLRNINTVVIADLESRAIVWAWGPSNLSWQHHPTLLDNGHLLIFNNAKKESEVLELDPLTLRVVWSYRPGPEFFSGLRGGNQRLPNGNTLITESDTGYVFEVTPQKEKVWEFANPAVNGKGERQAIWRMVRFRPEELPFLEQVTSRSQGREHDRLAPLGHRDDEQIRR